MADGLALADRLRIWARLAPSDEATVQALRRLLAAPAGPGAPGAAVQRAGNRAALPPAPPLAAPPLPPAPDTAGKRRRTPQAARGRATVAEPLPAQPWPAPARPAPTAAPAPLAASAATPAAAPPLLAPRRARGVLLPLVQTAVDGPDVDVPAVVRRLGAGLALERLPRLPVRSSRCGAQLLVDAGPALAPLAPDVEQVVHTLLTALGGDRVQLLHFAGTPGRGCGPGPRAGWRRWTPPPPGAPLLLLTDLGVYAQPLQRDTAGTAEWLAFLRAVRAAGCRAAALVPAPPARVPARLRAALTVLPWTDWLDAAHVLHVLGDGERQRRERP